ncbi:MAG TPA: nucleotidyltransferase domain-containing protein [Fimbriimonadaceae bacterium]|nr:nucleotidyltransferase domain-containing protein [Fimbriimonadaceae bacterium]
MSARQLVSKQAEIHALCQTYGVARLRLFGSALGSDWNPDSSDYDFIAEFVPLAGMNAFHQYMGFVIDLEKLLGRKVDVVDWSAATNPFFRRNAESHAREIFAA